MLLCLRIIFQFLHDNAMRCVSGSTSRRRLFIQVKIVPAKVNDSACNCRKHLTAEANAAVAPESPLQSPAPELQCTTCSVRICVTWSQLRLSRRHGVKLILTVDAYAHSTSPEKSWNFFWSGKVSKSQGILLAVSENWP